MGYRLTRITTRTGDDGSTGLADGRRLPKHAPRIAALGEVDELNSLLGVVLAEPELPAPFRCVGGRKEALPPSPPASTSPPTPCPI
jgi:cob(I)alamin adenosyltransferase